MADFGDQFLVGTVTFRGAHDTDGQSYTGTRELPCRFVGDWLQVLVDEKSSRVVNFPSHAIDHVSMTLASTS